METIHISSQTPLPQVPPPASVATIGFFDGVHRGHRYLISQVTDAARAEQLRSLVVTFDRHPRQVVDPSYVPRLLSTTDGKLLRLSKSGIDGVAVLQFDTAMAALSARDFMRDVLRDRLGVRRLIIGYDNRFGHNRAEGFDDYVRYGRELGIDVVRQQAFVCQGQNVSSSLVRRLLSGGEVEMAATCLGYPYTIGGRVRGGFHEGRRLGFPTANLAPDMAEQMLPAEGVYAVRVLLEGSMTVRRGMTNIGRRPTFGGSDVSLETHIFDFSENIYGRHMFVSFVHRIRGEQQFDSPEALAEQLGRDREMALEQFNKEFKFRQWNE